MARGCLPDVSFGLNELVEEKTLPVQFLLAKILRERNLPMTWVAEEAGLSVPALRRLKNDRARSIKFETLERLCDTLLCEPSELFELVDYPTRRRDWRRRRRYGMPLFAVARPAERPPIVEIPEGP